jgi:hypothetical protein
MIYPSSVTLSRSTRNSGGRIVFEYEGLAALVARRFSFQRQFGAEAGSEVAAIGKVDGNLGAVARILVEGERTHHFPGEFFALNHDLVSAGFT